MPDGAGGNPSHRMWMTVAFANSMLTPPKTNSGDIDAWLVLPRVHRVVLVVDVVESVRLMEQDEEDTITRWRAFVHGVERELLPQHGGRLVKSLGDGLMLEFERVLPAVQSALAMQRLAQTMNQGRGGAECMHLRMGVHAADVVVDDRDIYGTGVNLAARLASLAQPGQIVVSSEAQAELTVGLDAEVEDLGECYLKHRREPVHAFRLTAPNVGGALPSLSADSCTGGAPVIAVLPFESSLQDEVTGVSGDVIADALASRLSRSGAVRVISRLSTSAWKGRVASLTQVSATLGADLVVSGRCQGGVSALKVYVELCSARGGEIVWARSMATSIPELLQEDDDFSAAVSQELLAAVAAADLRRALTAPLPSLNSYSLQLAASSLMHRSATSEFDRAREVLDHLVERHPRAPVPRAWLAKWYVLRVTRALVRDLDKETALALEQTRRALEADPECSLALAMEGFVHCHMLRDLDGAQARLTRALECNPNDSLAWLFQCVVHGFRGQGESAWSCAERALSLSPLDPMRHYFDALAASAALAAGRLERAVELAQRSLRVNRIHLPTLRALAIAQVESGAIESARETARRILEIDAGFNVRAYVERGPRGAESTRERYARALRMAGLPAGG